jgi:hypothetical protein
LIRRLLRLRQGDAALKLMFMTTSNSIPSILMICGYLVSLFL